MGTIILILSYLLSLGAGIKAMITGRGILFPNFKRIDTIYFGGTERVWSTWWGILCYYILLLFNLPVFLLAILIILIIGFALLLITLSASHKIYNLVLEQLFRLLS